MAVFSYHLVTGSFAILSMPGTSAIIIMAVFSYHLCSTSIASKFAILSMPGTSAIIVIAVFSYHLVTGSFTKLLMIDANALSVTTLGGALVFFCSFHGLLICGVVKETKFTVGHEGF